MAKSMFSESELDRIEKEYRDWQNSYQKALGKVPERLDRFSTVSDL